MPKRPSVASTVMQVVTGSKPISELVSDFGEMCGEGWRAAGIRHLAVLLLGPCLWVVWCVFAMHLREYASEEYPLLADGTFNSRSSVDLAVAQHSPSLPTQPPYGCAWWWASLQFR